MSEALQTEINELIIERLAQLQDAIDNLWREVDSLKLAVRSSTIHPEMFAWSEAPHGR